MAPPGCEPVASILRGEAAAPAACATPAVSVAAPAGTLAPTPPEATRGGVLPAPAGASDTPTAAPPPNTELVAEADDTRRCWECDDTARRPCLGVRLPGVEGTVVTAPAPPVTATSPSLSLEEPLSEPRAADGVPSVVVVAMAAACRREGRRVNLGGGDSPVPRGVVTAESPSPSRTDNRRMLPRDDGRPNGLGGGNKDDLRAQLLPLPPVVGRLLPAGWSPELGLGRELASVVVSPRLLTLLREPSIGLGGRCNGYGRFPGLGGWVSPPAGLDALLLVASRLRADAAGATCLVSRAPLPASCRPWTPPWLSAWPALLDDTTAASRSSRSRFFRSTARWRFARSSARALMRAASSLRFASFFAAAASSAWRFNSALLRTTTGALHQHQGVRTRHPGIGTDGSESATHLGPHRLARFLRRFPATKNTPLDQSSAIFLRGGTNRLRRADDLRRRRRGFG